MIDLNYPCHFAGRARGRPKPAASFFLMKTNIYVDGFNLYFGALKGTPHKWLDLSMLSQAIVPAHEINRIRYFTAVVESRPDDPQQQRRQLTYIRALQTIPHLSVHYGLFITFPNRVPLTRPIPGVGRTVEADITREKGSDVNLATYLLVDGYEDDYEQAVVISNDSDLALPIRMVRDTLRKPAWVVNPSVRKRTATAKQLQDSASFLRPHLPQDAP